MARKLGKPHPSPRLSRSWSSPTEKKAFHPVQGWGLESVVTLFLGPGNGPLSALTRRPGPIHEYLLLCFLDLSGHDSGAGPTAPAQLPWMPFLSYPEIGGPHAATGTPKLSARSSLQGPREGHAVPRKPRLPARRGHPPVSSASPAPPRSADQRPSERPGQ